MEDNCISDETTIECFCCNRVMSNWTYKTPSGHAVEVHPMDGLHFSTTGHYGSTIFDPMDGTHLDIAICDQCIVEKKSHLRGNGLTNLE